MGRASSLATSVPIGQPVRRAAHRALPGVNLLQARHPPRRPQVRPAWSSGIADVTPVSIQTASIPAARAPLMSVSELIADDHRPRRPAARRTASSKIGVFGLPSRTKRRSVRCG